MYRKLVEQIDGVYQHGAMCDCELCVGRQEDEEKARRARVIAELERVEEERRQRIDDGTDASEADRQVGAAMLEEYIQHRRLGGGGGR